MLIAAVVVLGLGLLLYLPFYSASNRRQRYPTRAACQDALAAISGHAWSFTWINGSFLVWQLASWMRAAGRAGWLSSETWLVARRYCRFSRSRS